MLVDLNKRHVQEYKRTGDFLKFALGNRAPVKPKFGQSANMSQVSASMISASQMHNQSRLSQGPSGIKARQRSVLQNHATASSPDRLPSITGGAQTSMETNKNQIVGVKGRHRSLAGHGSSSASKGSLAQKSRDMQSHSLFKNSMARNAQSNTSDIETLPLNVRIQNTNKNRATPGSSKLPHLMAMKQAKASSMASNSKRAANGKIIDQAGIPLSQSFQEEEGGIVFMQSDQPIFSSDS